MIDSRRFDLPPERVAGYLPFSYFSSELIPKVAEIEVLRMIIFRDRDIQIRYSEGEAYVYKKYVIETDEGQNIIDTSAAVFKGGLGVTAKKIEMFIQGEDMFLRHVPLNFCTQHHLLDFITQGPPRPTFCCADFVQKLFDKYKPEQTNTFATEEWHFERLPARKQLGAGSAIALGRGSSKTKELQHFALSLGKGLYLSVAGDGGNLIVSELKALKKMYRSRNVYQISPKPPVTISSFIG